MYASRFRGYLSGVAAVSATGSIAGAAITGTTITASSELVGAGVTNSAWSMLTGRVAVAIGADPANDWDAGHYTGTFFVVTPSVACAINSLVQARAGEFHWLTNGSAANNLTINHQGTGTAAFKFTCPSGANFVLAPHETVGIWHDDTTNTWRVLAG
jgi:hypothetical protein